MKKKTQFTDVIVIGAGLLGCFTARHLARYDISVTVLEKEEDVCRGISKANTGIIYAGYDNKPGSHKSKLCIQANEDFDALCRELEVPFSRPGSLMIAYGPKADAVIRKKYENGKAGGIKDIRILSGSEALELEPNLSPGITSALWCSSTGTIDPWELCIAAYENAKSGGAEFSFGCEVTGIQRTDGGFVVHTDHAEYSARSVVNTAGLRADRVREMTEEPYLRIYPTAADYIVLDKDAGGAVSHIIFHEGEDGKGLTLVPTVDGNILIGPTNRDADEEEIAASEMRVSSEGIETLKQLCHDIIPSLELDKQIRTFGSLRPNVYEVRAESDSYARVNKSINDFMELKEDGLFSLIGIKTPGLTFSNELGKLTARNVAEYLGAEYLTDGYDQSRPAIVRARDLSLEERAALIEKDPDYGIVICSCMDVTRAEVRIACERGARSFEAVKRRTGAGMGRCQGSRCRKKILDIIDVFKENNKETGEM